MKPIRLVDLNRQHLEIQAELRDALSEVMARGNFILGPEVEAFEREFSLYCGTNYCVGVDSGTSAIELILRAIGAAPGDEVVVPAFTFVATASAVQATGASPVFADVTEETMTLDLAKALERVNERTRAVIPVHLYGYPAPAGRLAQALAGRCAVIEDACQAHGAKLEGARAGSFGAAAAFSFYPSKNLGGLGDGGMAATSDEAVARDVRALRNYGQTARYVHARLPLNRRLDEIQAAFLRIKLRRLDLWNSQRRAAAARYREALEGRDLILPPEPEAGEHVYYTFTVRCPRRDALAQFLSERGIETGIHYPHPLHLLPAFRHLGFSEGAFPVAERLAREVLSLPLFPGITEEEIGAVSSAIGEFDTGKRAGRA